MIDASNASGCRSAHAKPRGASEIARRELAVEEVGEQRAVARARHEADAAVRVRSMVESFGMRPSWRQHSKSSPLPDGDTSRTGESFCASATFRTTRYFGGEAAAGDAALPGGGTSTLATSPRRPSG
jgi:hypothetical protein